MVPTPTSTPAVDNESTTAQPAADVPEDPVDVSTSPRLRLLPSVCGPLVESKIIGGQEVAVEQYPWMALLGYETCKMMAASKEVHF